MGGGGSIHNSQLQFLFQTNGGLFKQVVTEAEAAAAAEVNYYITISIDVINKSIFF